MSGFKLTIYLLQFANEALEHSRGVMEDMIVKIDKFTFLVDFVVLDLEEDELEPSVKLGRPFLSMSGALIDILKRMVTLTVEDE